VVIRATRAGSRSLVTTGQELVKLPDHSDHRLDQGVEHRPRFRNLPVSEPVDRHLRRVYRSIRVVDVKTFDGFRQSDHSDATDLTDLPR
jgi:hypothetical protein